MQSDIKDKVKEELIQRMAKALVDNSIGISRVGFSQATEEHGLLTVRFLMNTHASEGHRVFNAAKSSVKSLEELLELVKKYKKMGRLQ